MKINYPIKYTAMPVIESNGYNIGLNELEEKYAVVCYIVSKCYLLKDVTRYKENGESIKEYEVVFPYQYGLLRGSERTIPKFNYSGDCVNSNLVDFVFDSYEEALQYATLKNEEICTETWVNLPYSENFGEKVQEKKNAFAARLAKYKMLEQQMLMYTEDLDTSKRKKLDNVITVENNNIKILACDLYEFIRVCNYIKFVIYTITPAQHEELIKYIRGESVADFESIVKNAVALLVHDSNNSVMKIVNPNVAGLYYLDEYGLLQYSDKMKKVTFNRMKKIEANSVVLYTTETLADLMDSYKKHERIDLSKFSGPLLNRVKKQ